MSPNNRSRLDDLKRLSLIIGITLGLAAIAGGIYRIVTWSAGLQTIAKAHSEHDDLKLESKSALTAHELECDEQHHQVLEEIKEQRKEVVDDLKVLRQRTWELLQEKRNNGR